MSTAYLDTPGASLSVVVKSTGRNRRVQSGGSVNGANLNGTNLETLATLLSRTDGDLPLTPREASSIGRTARG